MDEAAVLLGNPEAAISQIREIVAESSRLQWTRHALNRMEGDGITSRDVLTAVRTGNFKDPPFRSDKSDLECSIEGYSAGRLIRVALGLYVDDGWVVVIVTAFEVQ